MPDRSQVVARRRLALNARRLQRDRGWTQEEAAEEIGCSVQALQRVERAVTNTSVDFLALVATAYDSDLEEFWRPAGPWRTPKSGRPGTGSRDAGAPRQPRR